MVVTKGKKKDKLRGKRFHGAGNTKNRRGAGCKGGRGRAGLKKHKFSGGGYLLFVKGHKKRLNPKTDENALNLAQLNEIIENTDEKNLVKEKGLIVLDGQTIKCDKVLGRGTLLYKVLLKNMGASKKAQEKIQAANGIIEGFEAPEKE